jgi:hypothetical protein
VKVSYESQEDRLALSKLLFCHEQASYIEERLEKKNAWLGNGDQIFFCPNFLDLCKTSPRDISERIVVHVPPHVETLAIYAEFDYVSPEKLVDLLLQFRDLQILYLILHLDQAFYGEQVSKHTSFVIAPSLPPLHGNFDERELILELC